MNKITVEPKNIMGLNFYEFEGEHRIRDVELGQWLGLAKPANIRAQIRSMLDREILSDSDLTRAVCQANDVAGRSYTEFYLGEEAAIMVAARSTTAKGKKFARQLARMFLALDSARRDVEQLKALCFTRELSNNEKQLFIPLLELLAQARGEDPQTRSYPWGPWVGQLVYACAEGHIGELQKFRREINPECRHRDYNHMTEAQQQNFRRVLAVAEAFADLCAKSGEGLGRWRELMLSRYDKQPLQLTIADNTRRMLSEARPEKTTQKVAG